MVIFSVKQKKKLAIALMAVSLVSTKYSLATTPEQGGMLANIYGKIAGFITESKQRVDDFFSTKNKETYSRHIERMTQDLNRVEQEIILPLQEAIKEDASSDELYFEIVKKTNGIITELHINLQLLVSALRAQAGKKNAAAVIDALKTVQSKVAKNLVSLEKNIKELLSLCKQYDPELATMVEQLQGEFHRVNKANVNPVAVFTGILHRVKC